MPVTPEGKVKSSVKKLLDKLGAWYFMPMQNGMGRVGIPDFVICLQGYFVGVETKAPGKRKNTTPNQKRELAGIKRAGGISVVVDDVSQLEHLEALIRDRKTEASKAAAQPARPDKGYKHYPNSGDFAVQRKDHHRRPPSSP